MKFTCTKENLIHSLNLIASLTGKSSHLPILANVLITVTDSKVEMSTTNLEVAIRTSLRAKIDKPGSFTVPAKTLSEFVALLRDGQVEVELVENELSIVSGSSKTKIKGSSAEDYPVIPPIDEAHGYALDVTLFKEALSKVVIAVAKNEIRPELSGVYFGLFTERHQGLILAATDSYRLSEAKIPVSQGADVSQAILPARAVFEMIRLFGLGKSMSDEHMVRLWVSDSQMAIRYDTFEMSTRLIDGKYPDYAQIIPASFKTTATFPVDVMVSSIKAAGLFTASGINAVSFDLNQAGQTIAVSSTSTQTGEHSAVVEASVQGEENSILLNHRYVIEGLQHLSGDTAEFNVNGADAPCLLRSVGSLDFIYIVMPIRQ
jgi:DNA polymerase-3 subunit beta